MSEKFYNLCRMTQDKLKNHVAFELVKTHGGDVKIGDGFVFAQGKIPVLLVAHLDTVHESVPSSIVYNTGTQAISSPNGIGGDDRCGVYMILEIVKKYNCSVLFCEDEEVGGIGADKFTMTKLASDLNFNYMIEFDRKGKNDAVFYDCDNPEFEAFITKEFFKTNWGTFSDISILAPHFKCAAVNLSCGYYQAHTKDEYVVWPEMEKCIEEACKILERTTEDDKFEYIEAVYANSFMRGFSSYTYNGEFYADDMIPGYYLIQYTDEHGRENWFEADAVSTEEAVGMFCMYYPNLSFNHIVDIQCDNGVYR